MKVAVGYALPIGPTPTYHCRPVPEGYAVVGVDEIMPTFEVLDLHYPAGEGDVTVLGDAKNVTILWPKECIVLRNHTQGHLRRRLTRLQRGRRRRGSRLRRLTNLRRSHRRGSHHRCLRVKSVSVPLLPRGKRSPKRK